MRRELAFALNAQSQILDSVGRTRSNKRISVYVRRGKSENREPKRAKKAQNSLVSGTLLDCTVVQIEEAKLATSACNEVAVDGGSNSTGSNENEGGRESRISGSSGGENAVVECALEEKSRDENGTCGGGKLSVEKPVKRFLRSALKREEDGSDVTVVVNDDRFFDRGEKDGLEVKDCVVVGADMAESGEVVESDCATHLTEKQSELEQEAAREAGSTRIPMTVRELLETGMLEGYGVFYDHGKKVRGLQGTISGTGILCSCRSCNGCKVVPPSVFEIHACNAYRRAVQYICLENGRSFIEILKACRGSECDALEATIREAIGPPPEKVMIECQYCKEPFLTTKGDIAESRCISCVKSSLSIVSETPTSCEKSRTPKSAWTLKSSKKSSRLNSPQATDQVKVITRSSKMVSTPKPTRSPHSSKLQQSKALRNITSKKSKKLKLRQKIPSSPSVSSSKPKSSGKITKKDLRMHRLVFEEGGLPEGTELGYYAGGKRLLEGYKKGNGIHCLCCDSLVSASQFEAHAGCAARRKPYCYIYTSNGVSLHELSISLASKHTFKQSDDLCIICADGGNLVICDLCPRVYHPECASLEGIPNGKWYCKFCQKMFHREGFVAYNANAIAAGRVSGSDPIMEISKRCIRIVNDFETDITSCALCRGSDFSKSRFGPHTIILCDQCEKEYHVGCLKDHNMADLKGLPKGNWFCSSTCVNIHSTLQNLLVRGPEQLPNSLTNVIRNKHMQNGVINVADLNVHWRVISGKNTSKETKALLLQAIAIFHDGFSPIVDARTGRDLIPAMVYGNKRGMLYEGMYCAVLTVDSLVVCAAVFRVFGTEVAELPLVATIKGSHGKGYFQTLFGCVERLLVSLEVKSIVLPAAEEAKAIWTDKFGFRNLTPDEICNYRKNCWSMVFFQGNVMLHKAILPCEIVNPT